MESVRCILVKKRMKIRWRQHEMNLVVMIMLFALVTGLGNILLGPAPIRENFKQYQNLVWLQIILSLLQFLAYYSLNRFVVARLYPTSFTSTQVLIKRWLVALILVALISYIMGPVANHITYYLTQRNPDKGILNFVNSFFPLHPQPFFNTFGGLHVVLFYITLYLIYAVIREMSIRYLEREGGRRKYRIRIFNQVGLLISIYIFVVLSLLASKHHLAIGQSTAVLYFLALPATIALGIYEVYVVFPKHTGATHSRSSLIRTLLICTAVCGLPAVFLQRAELVGRIPFFIGGWVFQLGVTTPIAWAIFRQQKDRILELRGMEEALTRSTADLQFLRSQINPHFLFNSLNTLYGTAIEEGSKRTASGIQMLGDMMRFMLHDNLLEKISLNKEISYMQNYISLQKLRIQSSSQITIDTQLTEDCEHEIAPMLLIPLVENAFKHGISFKAPSWIRIELNCDNNSIQFTVKNSLHKALASDPEKESSGVGLVNVQERLRLLYPQAHTFKAMASADEFVASLTIYFPSQTQKQIHS